MYYVYILKSQKDGRTYTGYAKDSVLRLRQHNAGKVRATKNRRPFVLIYNEHVDSLVEAKWRENYWKSGGGRRKLKGYFERGFPPRPSVGARLAQV